MLQKTGWRWLSLALLISINGALLIVIMLLFGDTIFNEVIGKPIADFQKQRQQAVILQNMEDSKIEGIELSLEGIEVIRDYDLWFTSFAGKQWNIYQLDGSTGILKKINLQMDPSRQGLQLYGPAVSPDKSKIAFAAGPCAPGSPCQRDIYLADVTGANVVQLTNTTCNDESQPAWSPDGAFLAYTAGMHAGDPNCPYVEYGIWVMEHTDGTHKQLTNMTDFDPDWSPDGRYIVFTSTFWDLNIGILDFTHCRAEVDICGSWRVGRRDTYSPAWIDNSTIVFNAYNSGWNLYAMRVLPHEQGPELLLTSNPFDNRLPAVSNDGRLLTWQAYPYDKSADQRFETGKSAVIYVMDLTEKREVLLVGGTGNSRDPDLVKK